MEYIIPTCGVLVSVGTLALTWFKLRSKATAEETKETKDFLRLLQEKLKFLQKEVEELKLEVVRCHDDKSSLERQNREMMLRLLRLEADK